MTATTAHPILIVEDDPDDREFAREAFTELGVGDRLCFLEDGDQVLPFLRREAPFADTPLEPGLILLDLNMPRMDGRQVLQDLKSDPDLRGIPVVVLTTSKDDLDVLDSYDRGAASYVTKPVTYGGLLEALRSLSSFWLDTVRLPAEARARREA